MRKLRGQAHWLCQSPRGLPPSAAGAPAPAATQPSQRIHFGCGARAGGGAAPVEGADAPYGRKVRQPGTGRAGH